MIQIGEVVSNTSAVLSRMIYSKRLGSTLLERIVFYISVCVVLIVTLFPFYYMVVSSIVPDSELYSTPPPLIPTDITFAHYHNVLLSDGIPFVAFFLNSLIIATITATASVLVATFGAYSFSRLKYPGRGLFSKGVLIIYTISPILIIVPLFRLIAQLGLINTRPSLMVTYLVITLPVSLYMLGNYFRSLPKQVEEAALMDGYSRLEVIFYITIPLSIPAIIAVFLYVFMISWNEYLFATVFLGDLQKYTLPVGIETMNQSLIDPWGQIMAASVLTSIPIVLMFLYLEKYMVEGLTYGAVEG